MLMEQKQGSRHLLYGLAERYPQLALPVKEGMKQSEEFRNAVYRGRPVERSPQFSFSQADSLASVGTPAGSAEVLFLQEREDFEHAYRALACFCESEPILPSVGAVTISGLINWKKIRDHEAEYKAGGGENWSDEFTRFTSDPARFRDTILLLSSGDYSAVNGEQAGVAEDEWKRLSVTIRKYHELTHFVCRKLYPEKKEALRDEIYADCIGLIAAFGEYRPDLARLFLGIEKETYRPGGRLEHYAGDHLAEAQKRAGEMIGRAEEQCAAIPDKTDVFAVLKEIY